MRHIANPIYDVVFKFMLEDERITKDFLSLLLKKEVVEVTVRRNEYSNLTKAGVRIFRIDFAAKVKESNGQLRLILIELQKAMVETETLRFRQYLGVQYANSENMISQGDTNHLGVGLPIVAVYILGHKLGEDFTEPVVYVHRNYLNYNDECLTKGVPNEFIESLTHDSIIVQIPQLTRRTDNPLFAMLNVFDQSRRDDNRHFLHIDDVEYSASPVQKLILERLTMAASDPDVRQTMNVEDEVLGAIERRDDEIAKRDRQIEEKAKIIANQDQTIANQDQTIANQGQTIANQGQTIAEKDGQLAEKDGQLAEKDGQLAEKDGQLAEKDGQIALLVKMLVNGGQSIGEISIALRLPEEDVARLMRL